MMLSESAARACSRGRARPGAFTLVEMVVSLVIVTIIMVGMGGSLLISSQALPEDDSSSARIAHAGEIADEIASEISYATGFTELTANAVTFTVADRNADSNPETIRWSWSGTAGDPLTRQYNGGTVVTVAGNVHDVTLQPQMRSETVELPPEIIESAESVLASRDLTATAADFTIGETEWPGQYFVPALAADATGWKVTRVLVKARSIGAAKGIIAVQLRTPAAGSLPSNVVLEERLLYESALGSSYAWTEIPFTRVTGLTPGEGLCLVLACNKKDASLGGVQYDAGGGSGLLTTTTSGSTWTLPAGQSLQFYVYGSSLVSITPPAVTTYWLCGVRVSVQLGPDSATCVETAARILNEPEVTP